MNLHIRRTFTMILACLLIVGAFACTPSNPVRQDTQASAIAAQETAEPTPDTEDNSIPDITPEAIEMVPTTAITPVRVAALTGPTGLGLAYLTDYADRYELSLYTAPDQVVAKFTSGEADIAAVPINLAAALYRKLDGQVAVIAVNTLGVLYLLENGTSLQSFEDLAGKTIYATGQASTPQYILEKLLKDAGIWDQVQVEYVAEASALAAQLAEDNDTAIAFLPEPMVSVACATSDTVRVAFSANELWKASGYPEIVQGVYIVRKEFLEAHDSEVFLFLTHAEESVRRVLTEEDAADRVVELGIIGKAPIAKRAIPNCNIVLIQGAQMQKLVSAMLETLFEADPKSVGGALPAQDFYYVP